MVDVNVGRAFRSSQKLSLSSRLSVPALGFLKGPSSSMVLHMYAIDAFDLAQEERLCRFEPIGVAEIRD